MSFTPVTVIVALRYGCGAGLCMVGRVSSARIKLLSRKRCTQYPHPRTVSEPRRTVAAALSSALRLAQWCPAPSQGKGRIVDLPPAGGHGHLKPGPVSPMYKPSCFVLPHWIFARDRFFDHPARHYRRLPCTEDLLGDAIGRA